MKSINGGKIFTLLVFIIAMAPVVVNAQVQGRVQYQDKTAAAGVSVLLIRLQDSTTAAGQQTDSKGNFSFMQVAPGAYYIKCSMIGYAPNSSSSINYKGGPVELNIVLSPVAKKLEAVVVKSNQPQLEQQTDRLVINLQKMNTTGDNALDVLKKAPGIKLDKDDNIMLRGNGGVNVLINGKLTYMGQGELSSYLKTLPASAISKIELIANPPGNYDAEGTAGIINILMKRNRAPGYAVTATANAGAGRYGKWDGGLQFHYHQGELSLYSNLNQSYSNSYNLLTLNRQIGNEVYRQENYWHPINHTTSYMAGADYAVSKKSTVGFLFKGYHSPQNALVNSHSVTLNKEGQETASVTGWSTQKTGKNIYNLNLNYTLALDSAGQKLSVDADYVKNNGRENDSYVNTYFDEAGMMTGDPVYLQNNNPVGYTIKAVKGDYSYPFLKTWQIEAGWKSSWVNNDNNARFDSLQSAGWKADSLRSNHFLYRENINSAYLTMSNSFGNHWKVKASLRAEDTYSTGHSLTLQQLVKRHYLQFFPGVFITYIPQDNHQLTASFSRRITRPNYSSLNPFIHYTDPYTALEGNPYLQPSLSSSFLLGYSYKNFQVLSLSYLIVHDAVTGVLYQNDQTKESINRYENVGVTRNITASSSGSFDVRPWWNMNAEVEAAYDRINTVVQGQPYQTHKISWSFNITESLSLPHHFRLQVSGQYYSPSVMGLAHTLSASQVDIGLNKTILNKKATVSFKIRDLYFGSRYRSVLQYNNVNTTWQNEWESRRVYVGFVYTFGNVNIKAKERKASTANEETRM